METTSPKRAAPGASPVGSSSLGSTGTPFISLHALVKKDVLHRSAGRPEARKSATLREQFLVDLRSNIEAIRAEPYSHALVALATIIGWTIILVVPLLIGERF